MRNAKGFTLIETIMVIALLGIVAAIIAIPLSQAVKGWFQSTSREGVSQSGRIAIERMTREIRNTARKSNNTPCISTATATSFSFSDLNGDLTNCNSITFSRVGAGAPYTIQRTEPFGGTAYILTNNINSIDINYYNSGNGVIARPVSALNIPTIRRLAIEIVSTQGGEIVRKYNEVYLSNMK
jgi:prepilin-type N-terminal cleavage/methylation domain-containing protein